MLLTLFDQKCHLKQLASYINKVPRSTLQDKVKGRTTIEKKCGPETILTQEEENLLLAWLFRIAACEFPATKTMLFDSVQLLVKELNRPNNFTDGRPGRKWYELFLKRHQELAPRISQNLTFNHWTLNVKTVRWILVLCIVRHWRSAGHASLFFLPEILPWGLSWFIKNRYRRIWMSLLWVTFKSLPMKYQIFYV